MSLTIMAAAWAAASLSHTAKIVLLSLADNANDSGVCWPSISTVAKRCSLDERSVYRMITALEIGGHISTESRSGKSTIYRVHPCQDVTPDSESPLTPSQVTPDRQSQTPDSVSGTPDSLSPIILKNLKNPKGIRERRTARATLATRIPEGFELTPERRAVAETERADPEREFATFVDHWRSASGAKARKHDWDATWRNWCRRAADFTPRNGTGSKIPAFRGASTPAELEAKYGPDK